MDGNIFRKFCYYVDEHIFSKENMGSYVAFVVDQSFIDDFCRENHTTEKELMISVRCNLWNYRRDHYTIKGIVAIQLFAASKRANSEGLTVKNYRDRLSQVVDWDINDLQQWMSTYQENIWLALYRWCDENYFQITKCTPRTGTGRYVQFPVNQALCVFTEEDLQYIAKCFVNKRLFPGEDITQTDFWKTLDIDRYSLLKYFETRHAHDVVNNSVSDEDYLSQIYNYYLRWDGKYKSREKIDRADPQLNDTYVYITDDLTTLELRDENLKLLYSYPINNVRYSDVRHQLHFKRKGFLLFKKDDVYDNRWQEVRYIDANEEDYTEDSGMYGVAIGFKNFIDSKVEYKLKYCKVLWESKSLVIYKITRRSLTEDFFTEKRSYELFGGLKIGRNTYLKGATPILRLFKPSMVWIDGKAVSEDAVEGDYSLNYLEVGNHFIKLPNARKIKIDVVDSAISIVEWQDNYNKWQIGKRPAIWESMKSEQGVVGLDFSSISESDLALNESTTKRWAKALAFGAYHRDEKNIAIKLTKNHNERI